MPADTPDTAAGTHGHVLIVDDDALLRESLEQNLIDAGFRVSGFSNGPDVLAHFDAEGGGDLILLD